MGHHVEAWGPPRSLPQVPLDTPRARVLNSSQFSVSNSGRVRTRFVYFLKRRSAMQSRLAKGLLAFTVSVFASAFLLGPTSLLGAQKVTPKSSGSPPTVIHALKHDTSSTPLRMVHPPTKPFTGAGHEAARNEGPALRGTERKGVDPVVQRHFGSSQPTPVLNFDGSTAQEMAPFFGFTVAPPDTEGAVGATQ